ncbi:MAG: hypothetical protein AMXMBFR7_43560 [Planctomycetota bacterium]
MVSDGRALQRAIGWCSHPLIYRRICRRVDWNWRPPDVTSSLLREMRRRSTPLALVPVAYRELAELAAKGVPAPLDDVFPAAFVNQHAALTLDLCRQNGRLLALPDDVQIFCLALRLDLLRKLHLQPPATWGELETLARVLCQRFKRPMIGLPGGTDSHRLAFVLSLLGSAGADPSAALDTLLLMPDATARAFAWCSRLLREGLLRCVQVPAQAEPSASGLLLSDELVGYFVWPAQIANWLPEQQRLVKLVPFPRAPGVENRYSICHGRAWIVPANSAGTEAAFATLHGLKQPAAIRKLEAAGGYAFPAWMPAWHDPLVLRSRPLYRAAAELFKGCGRSLAPTVDHPRFRELLELFNAGMQGELNADEWLRRLPQRRLDVCGRIVRRREVHQAIAYIEQHLLDIHSVNQIAAAVELSTDHLNRLFQAELQSSCGVYLRRRRLEKARDLLLHSELSIKEVAWRMGFHGAASFSRAFRRQFGQCPSSVLRPSH